jgi:tRNA dimethylallyltransferase
MAPNLLPAACLPGRSHHQRGKVPIVVGGTGFYLRWFILGRPTTPPSSPEAAAKALQLIGQAWVRAAAEVTASQQQQQQQAACEAQQPAAGGTKQADAAQQQHRAGGSTDTAELLQRLPHVADAATRAAAAVLSEEQRWDAAVGVVADLGDPQSAERVRKERNNWYRLQRVVQILVLNGGKPLSEMDVDTTRELEYDFR